MRRLIKFIVVSLLSIAILIFGGISPSYSADLQMFSNARLINNPANDGDSFLVKTNGKSFRVRLYFVDCPETSVSSDSDAQRVREQTRYFGLTSAERVIHFGNEAKSFVDYVLDKPFTIHTAFASALGRSAKGRVYGFITTSDGDNLASLLVKNGFARTRGIGRKTPGGVSRNEMIERLRDLEISKAKSPQGSLDLNTATERELQFIRGIGPVLAERIIAGRPYRTVDGLLKVKGIGPKKLEKIRPYVVVGEE
jgi:competence ComEA-like helix-hairpin-helix protein